MGAGREVASVHLVLCLAVSACQIGADALAPTLDLHVKSLRSVELITACIGDAGEEIASLGFNLAFSGRQPTAGTSIVLTASDQRWMIVEMTPADDQIDVVVYSRKLPGTGLWTQAVSECAAADR
jgi:hypothetical protein